LNLLASCTGTIIAKILAFAAGLFLVTLTTSAIYSYFSEKDLAEEFTRGHVGDIADSYFDGLNKLMLTGAMATRDILAGEVKQQPHVLDARVIRGQGVIGQYGPGDGKETASDELDRAALQGKQISRIEETAQGRRLTLARPYLATEKTRGVNCLGCHSVPPVPCSA